MTRCRTLAAVGGALLLACGSGTTREDASAVALRWAAHLHVPRAAIELWFVGADRAGNVYALYHQVGPPEVGESVHLQKRDVGGAVLWDQAWNWPFDARPIGFAVTPLGNVLLCVAGAGPLQFGDVVVPIDYFHPLALVKVGPEGRVEWQRPLDRPAMPLATDEQGSVLAVDRQFTWSTDPAGAASGVLKIQWDGAPLWARAFAAPGFDATVASDGSGGLLAASADRHDGGSGLLSHYDDAGTLAWSNPLEHVGPAWIAALPGGGAVVYGMAIANARYAGAPLGLENTLVLLAVGPDGVRRWVREATGVPLASGTSGLVLTGQVTMAKVAAGLAAGLDLAAVAADGTLAWNGRIPAMLAPAFGGAAIDPAGRVTLGVVSARPFTVGGEEIAPFDDQSPVLLGIGPGAARAKR